MCVCVFYVKFAFTSNTPTKPEHLHVPVVWLVSIRVTDELFPEYDFCVDDLHVDGRHCLVL